MSMAMLLTQLLSGIPFGVQDAHAVISYEQEGFRFREDDGSETGATWIAPQDQNIVRPRNVNTRLRTLVNTTDDTPSNQYQLEYLKTYTGDDPEIESTSMDSWYNPNGLMPLTVAHTISAGEQLIVMVSMVSFAPDPYAEGFIAATYNGKRMLSMRNSFTTSTNRKIYAQMFYLPNPDVGTNNVEVSVVSGHGISGNQTAWVIAAHSVTGFSGVFGDMGTNSDGCTVGLTTRYDNSLILTVTANRTSATAASVTPSGSNVELYDTEIKPPGCVGNDCNAGVTAAGYYLTTTTAGSYTGGGTCSNTNGDSAMAIELVKSGLPYQRIFQNYSAPEIINSSSQGYTGASSFTLSHTVRSNEKLVVMVHARRSNADQAYAYPDVTFNGQPMERSIVETSTESSPTGRMYTSIHVLDNPDAGTYNVVVSVSAQVFAVVSAHSIVGFSGVLGAVTTGTTCSTSITTVANNSLLLSAASQRSNTTPPTIAPVGSNVELYEASTSSATTGVVGGGYSLATTTAGSYTGGGTCSSTVQDIVVIIELTPQAAQPIELALSSNISASGQNTTAQLTPPSGKNTGDFVTGRMQDDENPADAINITTDDYTELEWSMKATSSAAVGDTYRFRVTIAGTALNTYTVYPEMTIEPVFTQNDWRIYINNNAINPTDPWPNGSVDLGENAPLDSELRANDPLEPSDVVRLRMSIAITNDDLTSGFTGFVLAYAEATDCTTASGWTDVDVQGGAGAWRFYNSTVTDGATITTNRLGVSDVSGRVSESDPTGTNPSAVSAGQDLEWDWVIQYNGPQQATSYCFRIERQNGNALTAYNSDSYPLIATAPGTDDLMRHGNFYSGEVEKGFFWVGPGEFFQSENSPQISASASNGVSGVSSLTLSSFTVANNPNRVLVCGTTVRDALTVSSITWNGGAQSFTKIDDNQPGGDVRVELWYLTNPAVTTSNIAMTFSGSGNLIGGCVSLYNAQQTALSGSVEANGSDSRVTINLPTTPGQLVVDIVGDQAGATALSADSTQRQIWELERTHHDGGMSTQVATNSTTTMSWTNSGDDFWAAIAVPVNRHTP